MSDYIKPELLILIPVLVGIGSLIKASAISDRFIPLILGAIGIVLSALWVFGSYTPASAAELFTSIFSSITQGILIAAAAVYGNQMVKQLSNKDKDKEDTAQKSEQGTNGDK